MDRSFERPVLTGPGLVQGPIGPVLVSVFPKKAKRPDWTGLSNPKRPRSETFLPVVRMDTLCAILALVPQKDLKLHQMDVKGAYLNGTLQEIIYMKQHEGWEDETGRV